jgi:hypothetical protein
MHLSDAPERCARDDVVGVAWVRRQRELGGGEARGDAVDAHAIGSERGADVAGEAIESALRRGVVDRRRAWLRARGDGADVDDAPVLVFDHAVLHGPDRQKRPVHVHVDGALPVLERQLGVRGVLRDACVVHEQRHVAQLAGHLGHHRRDIGLAALVALHDHAAPIDGGQHFLCRGLVRYVVDRHLRAVLRQHQTDSTTDAAAAARHQSHFSIELARGGCGERAARKRRAVPCAGPDAAQHRGEAAGGGGFHPGAGGVVCDDCATQTELQTAVPRCARQRARQATQAHDGSSRAFEAARAVRGAASLFASDDRRDCASCAQLPAASCRYVCT